MGYANRLRCMTGRTKDNLFKWGQSESQKCPHCETSPQSIEHLVLRCPRTKLSGGFEEIHACSDGYKLWIKSLGQDLNPDMDRRGLSIEDVANQGKMLLITFVNNQLQRDGLEGAPNVEQLQEPNSRSGPPMEHIREIGRAFQLSADELRNDQSLNEMISKVKPDEERNTILSVTRKMFDDGIYTWGKICALFYFAYKVCAKALNKIVLMKSIINIIIDFMRDHVFAWIKDRGGWESIREYFGSTNRQVGFVFAGAVAAFAGVYAYKNWV